MTIDEPNYDRMRDNLMREVRRRRNRSRSPKRVSIFIGAGVLVAATTGGALIALASAELRHNSAYCYESPSLQSRAQQVGDPSPVGDDRVARAIDLCESVWRIGVLGGENDGPPPNDGRIHPVPELFVCSQRDGTLAVFPEQDGVACSDLSLEPLR